MKVMQINVVYKKGSTGKIVYDIHIELTKNCDESVVYYGRGAKSKDNDVHKIAPEILMKIQSLRSRITGFAYAGCFLSTNLLIKAIKKEKPDIVHLHCLNGYIVNIYKLLNYLKKEKISTILTLHAEFMYTAGCGYSLDCNKWKTGCGNCPQKNKERPKTWFFEQSAKEWLLMKQAFNSFDNIIIVVVSDWLYNRAIQSPFLKDKKLRIIYNGIDTDSIFKPRNSLKIKSKYKINDEKIILYVTPDFYSPIKGGKYFIQIANRFLNNKNVKFVLLGIDNFIDNVPKNIIQVKKIYNQKKLAEFYSLADLTLLTSERETFSMICAESLSCGTPVVGFKAGAPEKISLEAYSEFVEFGNINLLEKVIKNWLKKNVISQSISKEAKTIYSKWRMYEKYNEVYKELLK